MSWGAIALGSSVVGGAVNAYGQREAAKDANDAAQVEASRQRAMDYLSNILSVARGGGPTGFNAQPAKVQPVPTGANIVGQSMSSVGNYLAGLAAEDRALANKKELLEFEAGLTPSTSTGKENWLDYLD